MTFYSSSKILEANQQFLYKKQVRHIWHDEYGAHKNIAWNECVMSLISAKFTSVTILFHNI